jgi:hypothetical protein
VAYARFGALQMRSPSELRDRAARYVALAINARRDGDIRLACLLMDRVARLMEEADAAEAGEIIPPPPEAIEPNVQQQQQIQSKDDAGHPREKFPRMT